MTNCKLKHNFIYCCKCHINYDLHFNSKPFVSDINVFVELNCILFSEEQWN